MKNLWMIQNIHAEHLWGTLQVQQDLFFYELLSCYGYSSFVNHWSKTKKCNRKHAQIKAFCPLIGIPMQSFDSVTIDTDLDTVCSEQVQPHLKSAISNRTSTGVGNILSYACQMSCVLFVCWMHVWFYWCYTPFLFCMHATGTCFAKYADRVNSD